jgi:hypothetical protein
VISQIRNNAFTKILWGFMGLYLFNISVDTADPHPEHIPEDLSFNDQESVIEIIVEQLLGYENAIKEYDDHDLEDINKQKNLHFDLLNYISFTESNSQIQKDGNKQYFYDYKFHLLNGFNEIDNPPPQV